MPTLSENYGLSVGMVTDDFIEPEHVDRAARVLDRIVGAVMKRLLAAGVYEGWLLQQDKQVGPGRGLLAGCWAETETDQDISDLTSGAVNYVFALAGEDTAPQGRVDFVAQLSPVGPPGALYLGTMALDAQGGVVAVDSQAEGVDRGVFALLTETLAGSGSVVGVDPQETVVLEIQHEPLAIPGAVTFEVSEHFSFVLVETWRGDGFVAEVTNEDSEEHDLAYAWTRKGIRG